MDPNNQGDRWNSGSGRFGLPAPAFGSSLQQSSSNSFQPSLQQSSSNSFQPSLQQSSSNSFQPSTMPSFQPSTMPSFQPSLQQQPSGFGSSLQQPSFQPSTMPSFQTSTMPSFQTSTMPSFQPSLQQQPSGFGSSLQQPSFQPSTMPSFQPSLQQQPSGFGSSLQQPSFQPSTMPSFQPSGNNTFRPSSNNTFQPSSNNTFQPSTLSSFRPSGSSSFQPSQQQLQRSTVGSGISRTNLSPRSPVLKTQSQLDFERDQREHKEEFDTGELFPDRKVHQPIDMTPQKEEECSVCYSTFDNVEVIPYRCKGCNNNALCLDDFRRMAELTQGNNIKCPLCRALIPKSDVKDVSEDPVGEEGILLELKQRTFIGLQTLAYAYLMMGQYPIRPMDHPTVSPILMDYFREEADRLVDERIVTQSNFQDLFCNGLAGNREGYRIIKNFFLMVNSRFVQQAVSNLIPYILNAADDMYPQLGISDIKEAINERPHSQMLVLRNLEEQIKEEIRDYIVENRGNTHRFPNSKFTRYMTRIIAGNYIIVYDDTYYNDYSNELLNGESGRDIRAILYSGYTKLDDTLSSM